MASVVAAQEFRNSDAGGLLGKVIDIAIIGGIGFAVYEYVKCGRKVGSFKPLAVLACGIEDVGKDLADAAEGVANAAGNAGCQLAGPYFPAKARHRRRRIARRPLPERGYLAAGRRYPSGREIRSVAPERPPKIQRQTESRYGLSRPDTQKQRLEVQ